MHLPRVNNLSLRASHYPYLAQLTPHLIYVWQWWIAELYELLPTNLKVLLETNNQCLIVSVEGDQFLVQRKNADYIEDIGRILLANDDATKLDIPDNIQRTILILPQDKVLSREITLPLATEENLREVLSFEMDEKTPFTADQVYYEYLVTGRRTSGKTLSLQLFVTPRNIIDDSLTRLAKKGLHPHLIAPYSKDNRYDHRVNLMPALKAHSHGFSQHRLNQSLSVLALLLFMAMLALPLLQNSQAIKSLEEDITQTMITASESDRLRQEIDKLVTGSKYVIERKQTETTMIHLLNEMSRVIPNNTWVNRIDIDHGEVQLQGQSGSAAGLIALIEESPIFQSAQFRSPITQVARTKQERFHLSADTLQRAVK